MNTVKMMIAEEQIKRTVYNLMQTEEIEPAIMDYIIEKVQAEIKDLSISRMAISIYNEQQAKGDESEERITSNSKSANKNVNADNKSSAK